MNGRTGWGVLTSWSISPDYDGNLNCTQSPCTDKDAYGHKLDLPLDYNLGDVINVLITHIEVEHGIKLRPFRLLAGDNDSAEVYKYENSPAG